MSALLGALVASPHFRWRVGLPVLASDAVDGPGVVTAVDDGGVRVRGSDGWERTDNPLHLRPVSSDPFFKGWLLHLVREAWGDPCIHVAGDGITWCVENGNLDSITTEFIETEAEALVAALLAAPPKETS